MERLTMYLNTYFQEGPTCASVSTDLCYQYASCYDCPQAKKIFATLAAYEDTGLEPEEVQRLKLGAAVEQVKLFDGSTTIARLRELAAADKENRLLIMPPTEPPMDPQRQMLLEKIGPDALRLLDMLEGRG